LALISFTVLIAAGTVLLCLPFASHGPISLLDLLFTATSATCVTGLLTISLDEFTFFGKAVIMVLMQLGALSLSTIALSIVYLLKNPGLSTQVFAAHVLDVQDWHGIRKLLIFIVKATCAIELLGILLVFPIFFKKYILFEAIFFSFFHVIASFCNAGIAYEAPFNEQHLIEFSHNVPFLCITGFLILAGTLGFVTMQELLAYAKSIFDRKLYTFSLSTKLVLWSTVILLFLFTSLFFVIERRGAFSLFSLPMAFFQSFFHAISFKSCGFTTVPLTDFHPATLLLIILSGFIGSAPGSTGSGIKIIAGVIYLATVRAVIYGRNAVELNHRTVPAFQVLKSIAIVSLHMFWIFLTLFLLLFFEAQGDFFDRLFEASNAVTNLGLSMHGLQQLSLYSKVILILAMLVGRIGSLTLIASLRLRYAAYTQEFSYPEERVMLG